MSISGIAGRGSHTDRVFNASSAVIYTADLFQTHSEKATNGKSRRRIMESERRHSIRSKLLLGTTSREAVGAPTAPPLCHTCCKNVLKLESDQIEVSSEIPAGASEHRNV